MKIYTTLLLALLAGCKKEIKSSQCQCDLFIDGKFAWVVNESQEWIERFSTEGNRSRCDTRELRFPHENCDLFVEYLEVYDPVTDKWFGTRYCRCGKGEPLPY